MSLRRNWALLFVFTFFYFAAAAPVPDEGELEALLQEALEDDAGSQNRRNMKVSDPWGETQRPFKETQSSEEESAVEEQENDNIEIQKFKIFKSLLGKALKVLKHKIRKHSRTDREDEEALKNPTRWRDLARNVLGAVGDRLDPTLEENVEEQVTENKEMEKFREDTAAEIEGLRSLLGSVLRILNRKLKPRQRTEDEDRQVLENPTKWRDLGRYYLQILQDRLNKSKGMSEPQEEAELENLLPDPAINDPQGDQMAEAEFIRTLARKLLRLLRKFKRG